MLRTPLGSALGIEYPILFVGMGALAGPELTAAVSNAGACVLYAGESCRLIQDVKPAALIVHDLMREVRVALDGLGRS